MRQVPILEPVTSSQIQSIGFDNGTLYVKFAGGGACYSYTGEGIEAMYQSMKGASSVGSFFHKNIRNNGAFTYEKLSDEPMREVEDSEAQEADSANPDPGA